MFFKPFYLNTLQVVGTEYLIRCLFLIWSNKLNTEKNRLDYNLYQHKILFETKITISISTKALSGMYIMNIHKTNQF